MRGAALILCLLTLAGCGADGEPVQPTFSAGIGIGSGGVRLGGAVGVSTGPLNISLGF